MLSTKVRRKKDKMLGLFDSRTNEKKGEKLMENLRKEKDQKVEQG
jgi:hypothetical protein